MSSVISDAEMALLEKITADYGVGVKNLGRDPSMFNMDSFTLSVTFELDSLSGGKQALLWNHGQYGIVIKNDNLQIALRGDDGRLDYYTIADAFDDTGWHDVQIVFDDSSNNLEFRVDGETLYQSTADSVDLSEAKSWNVYSGGVFGKDLDGRIADVSILDEAVPSQPGATLVQRMYDIDAKDPLNTIEVEGGPVVPPIEVDVDELAMLAEFGETFGEGSVSLGRDSSMFGMDDFTLSATFNLDSVNGGTQYLLWNHGQYGIIIKNDDLQVAIRGDDGYLKYVTLPDVLSEAGWHDVQVVMDSNSGELKFWLDGNVIYSGSSDGYALTDSSNWDVYAGGAFGSDLDGQIADVTISDEAKDIDEELSVYDRMLSMSGEESPTTETPPTENTDAVITGADAGNVVEDSSLTVQGKLTATDVDSGESGFQAGVVTGVYGALTIDAAGNWSYSAVDSGGIQALGVGDSLTDTITVKSIDGTTSEVTITIQGSNDIPIITGADSGSVVEDGSLTTQGKITATDADSGESGFQAGVVTGIYGALAIDASGNWNYSAVDSASIQALNAGESLTDTITVKAIDGSTSEVTITIQGTNDYPIISGTKTGTVVEDALLTTQGKLSATDADGGESGFQAGVIIGAYGALVMDVEGNWSYSATDSNQLQSLGEGDSLTDTITVKATDGSPVEVAITIQGTNDDPVITGDDTGNIAEDGALSAQGKLTATDVDSGESGFQELSEQGVYGDFSINSDGNWSYVAAESPELAALNNSDHVTETFKAYTIDGTETIVTVTIDGAGTVTSGKVIEIGSVGELNAFLKGDVSGYTIKLLPGTYDNVDIYQLNPANGVIITSSDPNNPAILDDVDVVSSNNITFNNLVFQSADAAVASYGDNIVVVDKSNGVTFESSQFLGREGLPGEGFNGLYVKWSSDIDVSDSLFDGLTRGAGFANSSGVTVSGNEVTSVGTDGFNFAAVRDVLIEDNNMHNFTPFGDHHPDYIQFWTAGTDTPTENVVIRNNFLSQGDGGPSQGIFITDQIGLGYSNFVIENNVVYQSGYHGITVGNIDGVVIQNNTVLGLAETDNYLWISVSDSTGVIVEDNISNVLTINGVSTFGTGDITAFAEEGNIIAWQGKVTGALTYDDVFANNVTQNSVEMTDFVIQGNLEAGANIDKLVNISNEFSGDSGDNQIDGTSAGEVIRGFEGSDVLSGFGGDDTLIGGLDRDYLTGGDGDDIFVFTKASDSGIGVASRDVITDFDAVSDGEKLSLEGLGNGTFNFIGGAEFSAQAYTEVEQNVILDDLSSKFGSGAVSLGRSDEFFDLQDMTLSVTFELNDLNSGLQHLIWNHTQYAISVENDDLSVQLRTSDGSMRYFEYNNALSADGWHDVQVVMDSGNDSLEIWMDGEMLDSQSASGISIGSAAGWDIWAGGAFGKDLNGSIADVTILDEAVSIGTEDTVFERMMEIDDLDIVLGVADVGSEDTQVRFDESTGILSADLDGDQIADMEIELIGVKLSDLDAVDFVF